MRSLKKELEKRYEVEVDVRVEVQGCGVDDLALIDIKEIEDDLVLFLAKDEDADLTYIVRADAAGFRSVCIYNTGDDQSTLASWNVDFNITILNGWVDEDEINLCLDIAEENDWGF